MTLHHLDCLGRSQKPTSPNQQQSARALPPARIRGSSRSLCQPQQVEAENGETRWWAGEEIINQGAAYGNLLSASAHPSTAPGGCVAKYNSGQVGQ